MTLRIDVEDGRGTRPVKEGDFPLAVGGSEADIALPGIDSGGPLAYLGLSQGELFVQPGHEGGRVVCNGALVTTSKWLRNGDVLHFGRARVLVEVSAEQIRFRVEQQPEENDTEPPRVVPTAPPQAAGREGSGVKVKPVAFEPKRIAVKRRARRLGPMAVVFWCSLVLLGVVSWYLFTARSVLVEIEPTPDTLDFEGGLLSIELAGRHLVRPGRYTVIAEKKGYRRLESPVEVTGERSQTFRLTMLKLPGLLAVSTAPVEGAAVLVDDAEVGVTPIETVELAPGEHDVVIRAERYQEYSTRVLVKGGGVVERLDVELAPRWAPVTFRSEPRGAAVRVDGDEVGTTPVTADILEGAHTYELILAGRKPHRGRLVVVAGEAQSLSPIGLALVDGNLVLTSNPTGANVTVDGTYRGQTPLDVFLSPGQMHQLAVSRAGYEAQERQVQLRSGESQTLNIDLMAQLGVIEIACDPPDAELYVNGESRGRAAQVIRLGAVPQRIEIKKDGYEPFQTMVTPQPGFPQSIEVVLQTVEEVKAETTPTLIKSSQGHELGLIGPRRFRVGASRREPGRRANETVREVELTRSYYLSTMEVTNRQFREFKRDHRSGSVQEHNLEIDHHPVVRVSWEDAALYCNWLSEKDSLPAAYVQRDGKLVAVVPLTKGYRLPTEAEWVGAARYPDGQSSLKYPWGSSLPVAPNSGNYADVAAKGLVPAILPSYSDSYAVTAPAGSFKPNLLGLYDLGGNVAEWMHDLYTIYPPSSKVARDPLGPEDGKYHVIRGASWMHGTVTQLRLAYRDYGDKPRPDVGFRIARYTE